jgi:hypothetical protein
VVLALEDAKEEDTKEEEDAKVVTDDEGDDKKEGEAAKDDTAKEDDKAEEPKAKDKPEDKTEETTKEPKPEEAIVKEEPKPTPPKPQKPTTGSLGFGFINFGSHEAALRAISAMNNKPFSTTADPNDPTTTETITKPLFIGRAQKKAERERELRSKYEAEKMERIAKFQGINLYVKNLDESVTDEILREEFALIGTITSARVMRDITRPNASAAKEGEDGKAKGRLGRVGGLGLFVIRLQRMLLGL